MKRRRMGVLVSLAIVVAIMASSLASPGEPSRAQAVATWAYPWCGGTQPYISGIFDHDLPKLESLQDWWHIKVYAGDRRPDCRIPPPIPDPWQPGDPLPTVDNQYITNFRRCVKQPEPLPTTRALCWRYDTHPAWDYYMPYGAPVFAADAAKVNYVGYLPPPPGDPPNSSGMLVLLKHDDAKYNTIYNHLSATLVSQGEQVFKGQRIGTLGRTGLGPTHPHLHFESQKSPGGPSKVFDPYGWTSPDPDPWEQFSGVTSERMFDPGIWQGRPMPDCDKFNTGGPFPVQNDDCPSPCGQLTYADDEDPLPTFECTSCGGQRGGGYRNAHRSMSVSAGGSTSRAVWRFCDIPAGTYQVEIRSLYLGPARFHIRLRIELTESLSR